MPKVLSRLFSLQLFLCCIRVAAAEPVLSQTTDALPVASPDRFGRFEDSYAVWQKMRNVGWISNDEGALRAHYSFAYTFCGPRIGPKGDAAVVVGERYESPLSPCKPLDRHGPKNTALLFGYTGEFDFYVGTRDSGPVINRLNNPGFFLRVPLTSLGLTTPGLKERDNLMVGLEHRSDGQAVDVTTAEGISLARQKYAEGDHAFFDTVSVGANYWSLTLDRGDVLDTGIDVRVKTRLYLKKHQESAVTWGPKAFTDTRFSDYDVLQVNMARSFGPVMLDGEWRIGKRGLATDSWTLGLEVLAWDIPFYIRLHRGPMNTLSNYTQRQDSIGIGLRFARYR